MAWDFDSDRAIYIQIVERLKFMIISGAYKKGDKVSPVRDLSKEAGVNPNTMQKALGELERIGLMQTSRTSGRYITDDEEIIKRTKEEFAEEKISLFIKDMNRLGYDKKDILNLLTDFKMEEKDE